jgi:hypothetical protein
MAHPRTYFLKKEFVASHTAKKAPRKDQFYVDFNRGFYSFKEVTFKSGETIITNKIQPIVKDDKHWVQWRERGRDKEQPMSYFAGKGEEESKWDELEAILGRYLEEKNNLGEKSKLNQIKQYIHQGMAAQAFLYSHLQREKETTIPTSPIGEITFYKMTDEQSKLPRFFIGVNTHTYCMAMPTTNAGFQQAIRAPEKKKADNKATDTTLLPPDIMLAEIKKKFQEGEAAIFSSFYESYEITFPSKKLSFEPLHQPKLVIYNDQEYKPLHPENFEDFSSPFSESKEDKIKQRMTTVITNQQTNDKNRQIDIVIQNSPEKTLTGDLAAYSPANADELFTAGKVIFQLYDDKNTILPNEDFVNTHKRLFADLASEIIQAEEIITAFKKWEENPLQLDIDHATVVSSAETSPFLSTNTLSSRTSTASTTPPSPTGIGEDLFTSPDEYKEIERKLSLLYGSDEKAKKAINAIKRIEAEIKIGKSTADSKFAIDIEEKIKAIKKVVNELNVSKDDSITPEAYGNIRNQIKSHITVLKSLCADPAAPQESNWWKVFVAATVALAGALTFAAGIYLGNPLLIKAGATALAVDGLVTCYCTYFNKRAKEAKASQELKYVTEIKTQVNEELIPALQPASSSPSGSSRSG